MKKIEYDHDSIIYLLQILNTLSISGMDNIKKLSEIIRIIDSGKIKYVNVNTAKKANPKGKK